MKKEIFQEIKIPEKIEISLNGKTLIVKGPLGENKKIINLGKLEFKIEPRKIIIGHKSSTKKEKRNMNTLIAHIENMIKGVQEKFQYKLKICHVFFPFTVKLEGNQAIIKNFLGEKIDRKSEILKGADVDIDKDIITVSSIDKEIAGQTAANLEKATRVKKRDIRIFQDGIYIINKNNKEI